MAQKYESEKPITSALNADSQTNQGGFSDEDRVASMVHEFRDWDVKCEEYRVDMRIDEELFQGYNRDNPEQIPTNTGASIIESFVARTMDASWKVSSRVKGFDGKINRKINQALHNLAEDIRDDPDVAEIHGTYASQKEMMARDFYAVGNFVGTVEYCYQESVSDDGTVRKADGAYLKYHPWDRYTFNPAMTWETSKVKYLRDWTSMYCLEEEEYKEETVKEMEDYDIVGQDGNIQTLQREVTKKKVTGKWKNLDKLRELASNSGMVTQRFLTDSANSTGFFTGNGTPVAEYIEDIKLLVRADGAWLTVIAEDSIIIYEEFDEYGLGCDQFVVGMNYKFKNRPFGYGEMSLARGIIKLKDQSFNQRGAVIERALKVGVLINDPQANTDVITNVLINGGVAKGNASSVTTLNAVNLPQNAFLMAQEYQTELERVLRYSAYAAGMPNQATDKTNGTFGGIKAIQAAAEPNFNIKLRIMQERLDTPFIRKSTKMVASQSMDDDIRWALRAGTSNEYAKYTKRFLQGKPLLSDLVQAGIIQSADLDKYTHTNRGTDPQTGQPILVPIPGVLEAPYVDADWALSVTLDPKTAADRFDEGQAMIVMLEKAEEKGIAVDWPKALPDAAAKMGSDELEEYFLPEGQQTPAMQQAQGAQQAAQAAEQAKVQGQLQLIEAKGKIDIELKKMEIAHDSIKQSVNFKDETPAVQDQMNKDMGYDPGTDHVMPTHLRRPNKVIPEGHQPMVDAAMAASQPVQQPQTDPMAASPIA